MSKIYLATEDWVKEYVGENAAPKETIYTDAITAGHSYTCSNSSFTGNGLTSIKDNSFSMVSNGGVTTSSETALSITSTAVFGSVSFSEYLNNGYNDVTMHFTIQSNVDELKVVISTSQSVNNAVSSWLNRKSVEGRTEGTITLPITNLKASSYWFIFQTKWSVGTTSQPAAGTYVHNGSTTLSISDWKINK